MPEGITTPTSPFGSNPITQPSAPAPAPPQQHAAAPPTPQPNLLNQIKGQAGQAFDQLKGQAVKAVGGQAGYDLHQTLSNPAYNIPEADRWNLMSGFNKLRQAQEGGGVMDKYQQTMGMMGRLKQYHPGLPGAVGSVIEKHQPGATTGWNMANAWHGMVGNPTSFAQLASTMAPGLLKAIGPTGPAGLLGLYGMLSGDQTVLNDLKTLATPSVKPPSVKPPVV